MASRGDALAMKDVLLGAMPARIYNSATEFWKLLGLVDLRVVLALLRLLILGWFSTMRRPSAP